MKTDRTRLLLTVGGCTDRLDQAREQVALTESELVICMCVDWLCVLLRVVCWFSFDLIFEDIVSFLQVKLLLFMNKKSLERKRVIRLK